MKSSFAGLLRFGVLLLVAFVAPERPVVTEQPGRKPNIIYILMDDLGVEEIEPYGNRIFRTPNLTRMAAEGLRFTNHYAGTSVCAPSRCALMTGLHTGHCEVRGNKQMEPHGQMPLSPGTVTVAERLKEAGYQTALFGKWGLGTEGTTGEPTRQGFDQYYGYLDQVLAHNNFPEYLLRNGRKEYLKNKVVYEPVTSMFKGLGSHAVERVQYSNDLFTEEGLRFIGQKHTRPFFLYLSYTLPHNNGEAPEDQRFQSPTLEPYTDRPWTDIEKNYAATITRMDDYIGRILAKLKETGQAGNTLVLFSSDNGSTEDIPRQFVKANTLRGFKRSPYEGGIRAPLLAWWPGTVRPGSADLLTAQWDFLATACDLAGAAPPPTDGISLMPTLLGQNQQRKAPHLYWEFHEQGGWQAIRQRNEKLIFFVRKNSYELYDLNADPGERNNLAASRPGRVSELKKLLQESRHESTVFRFGN